MYYLNFPQASPRKSFAGIMLFLFVRYCIKPSFLSSASLFDVDDDDFVERRFGAGIVHFGEVKDNFGGRRPDRAIIV
jgi:hypothetical protein